MNEQLQKQLSQAKMHLLMQSNAGFIAPVIYSLEFKENTSPANETARIIGTVVEINADFFDRITPKERVFLLAHEAWHLLLKHQIRMTFIESTVNATIFNEAADHVINLILNEEGFSVIPGSLCDSRFIGLSTEQVYEILIKEHQKNSGGSGGSNKGNTPLKEDLMELPTSTTSELAILDQQISKIISDTVTTAKLQGNALGTLPSELETIIDDIYSPKLNWDVILRKYIQSFAKEDYSFSRPNRRYLPDMYLPTLHSESLGEVVFAFDCSGSVSDQEISVYLNQVKYVQKTLSPDKITIVIFDTKVREVFEFTRNQRINDLQITARGGTSFFPLFEFLEKRKPVIACIFSDMQCTPIREKPSFPVVWIAVNAYNPVVKHGKLIEMRV